MRIYSNQPPTIPSLMIFGHVYLPWVNTCLAKCLNRFLNVKGFNKEKALVGAFSVIVQTSRIFVSSSSRQWKHIGFSVSFGYLLNYLKSVKHFFLLRIIISVVYVMVGEKVLNFTDMFISCGLCSINPIKTFFILFEFSAKLDKLKVSSLWCPWLSFSLFEDSSERILKTKLFKHS